MNNKKRKKLILAVPLTILLVFLMASCATKESINEAEPLQTEAIETESQGALSFEKLSDDLRDIFSYQKYDFSAFLSQGNDLDGFSHIQDINSTTLYYWLYPKSENNQLYSYNYTDRDSEPQLLFEFNWDKIFASNSRVNSKTAWVWLQDKKGHSVIYKANSSGKEIVFEADSSKMIIYHVSDDYLFVSWREGKSEDGGEAESGHFIIQAINLQNSKRDTIAKTNYTINKKGQFSGQVLITGGMSADGKGLYYQMVTLDNEYVEYQGDVTLKYYSCESKETTDIMDMKKKIDLIYGTEEYMLISEYVYDKPVYDTVKIYQIQDGHPGAYFAVPEIQNKGGGINKVVNVKNKGNEYLIFNGSDYCIYAYDVTNKTYVAYKYAKNYEEAQKYSIHIGEDAIRIIEYNENGLAALHVYSLK